MSEQWRRYNKKRFKEVKGYFFDKNIFRIALGVIVIAAILMVFTYGFSPHVYVTCPEDTPGYCENPLYDDYDCVLCNDVCPTNRAICAMELLPPGFEWGERPGVLYSNAVMIFFALLMVAFLANHFIHNPRFAF